MKHTAALIEYTITGLISLIWISLIINKQLNITINDYSNHKEILILVAIPASYISGIFVDVFSSYLTKLTKKLSSRLKIPFFQKSIFISIKDFFVGTPNDKSYDRSVQILANSPSDLIRTMEIYVSRERIARGMLLNSLIIFFTILFTFNDRLQFTLGSLALDIASISYIARLRLKNLSDAFKNKSLSELKKISKTRPNFKKKI